MVHPRVTWNTHRLQGTPVGIMTTSVDYSVMRQNGDNYKQKTKCRQLQIGDKMETTTNRRQNADNCKQETKWRQLQIGDKLEASLSSEIKPKTWGQTGDSKSTIKGLSHLALSLSLSSTFLLEGPGHTTSPTCTIPEKHLSPGIKHTCTIPKNIPKSRNQT